MLASDTAIEGVVGTAIDDQVLPEATGDGDLTYSVSAKLPAGLSFDSATRTLSGTPHGGWRYRDGLYAVVDGDTGEQVPSESAVLIYNIEIAEQPAPTTSVERERDSDVDPRKRGDDCDLDHSYLGGSRSGCRDDQLHDW